MRPDIDPASGELIVLALIAAASWLAYALTRRADRRNS